MISDLVTTIIPVFNRPVQLREAVSSVLTQDWPHIEIIIVDDGSTDGQTLTVAEEFAASHPDVVRVATQPNGGPGVAREHGRKLARGEFIQYLDSDDILLPGKFSAQVGALRAHPDADVAYGITKFRDHTGKLHPEPHKDTGILKATMFPSFLNSRWWDTATPLYRARVCSDAGPWLNQRLEEDWEYDCRIAALGGRLTRCPEVVSETRDHSGLRLSRGQALDPIRLRQRASAHQAVYAHAVAYGITPETPEMQIYSRTLFLLARQCGAARLRIQSEQLFRLSVSAAGPIRASGIDFKLYKWMALLFGWCAAGRLTCVANDSYLWSRFRRLSRKGTRR
jgi:glycosyltransferase involved in cell wall biosynthesis